MDEEQTNSTPETYTRGRFNYIYGPPGYAHLMWIPYPPESTAMICVRNLPIEEAKIAMNELNSVIFKIRDKYEFEEY